MMEVWKSHPTFVAYELSTHGNIRRPGYLVEPRMIRAGYLVVYVYNEFEQGTSIGLHRLVLETFEPKPSSEHICCHKDGYPNNNNISNLYWGTRQENSSDISFHGLPEKRYKIVRTVKIIKTPKGPRQKLEYRLINNKPKSD